MKRSVRIFYVLYLQDPELSASIDAIRFILNPMEKQRAHVTVRGPYKSALPKDKLDKYNEYLKNAKIDVTGIGSFISDVQQTVFLKCEAPFLKQIWSKPDFDFHPHITLYDGQDTRLSKAFLKMTNQFDLHFSFQPTSLKQLESTKGQYDFSPHWAMNSSVIHDLFGEHISLENIKELDAGARILWAEKVMRRLSVYQSDICPPFREKAVNYVDYAVS